MTTSPQSLDARIREAEQAAKEHAAGRACPYDWTPDHCDLDRRLSEAHHLIGWLKQMLLDQERDIAILHTRRERIIDLENRLHAAELLLTEAVSGWEEARQDAERLKHACLNAIGFLHGVSIMSQEQLLKTLVETVRPFLVNGSATEHLESPEPVGVEGEK